MKSKQIWYVTKANPTKLECSGVYKCESNVHTHSYTDMWNVLQMQYDAGLLLHLSCTMTEVSLKEEVAMTDTLSSSFKKAPEVLELNVAAKGAKKPTTKKVYGKTATALILDDLLEA